MLERTDSRELALTVVQDKAYATPEVAPALQRVSEAIPGLVSWFVLLGPVWLTLVNPSLGFAFVSAFALYFVLRASFFGIRGLWQRRKIAAAANQNWLHRLELADAPLDWHECRVTFLIRAFREGNVAMLRNTLEAIYASNWPKVGRTLEHVDVVFVTEMDDPVTPPVVEQLAVEFECRLPVRQIKHPLEPGTLPGPSTAMHYVGRALYREALANGISPHRWIIADLDADTLLHPEYLPCMVHHFVCDSHRQLRVYQPVVAFTIDYWHAPLHSRLAALGTTALTVSWIARPEIAFTGAAATLALLRTVDYWPTNSHSQDSGIDLRLRMRYGRRYRVVGLPVPLQVYPVMLIQRSDGTLTYVRAYLQSFVTLFRQSARWREGPLDEFVEALQRRHLSLTLQRLWNGLERDTLTILPGYGYLAARAVSGIYYSSWTPGIEESNTLVTISNSLVLSVASVFGLLLFWLLLARDGPFVSAKPWWQRALELLSFWLAFGVYVPIITGIAGLRTCTLYLLGRRPRGHFVPTPK